MNLYLQERGGGGFGGIAIFRELLLMSVVCRTALILDRTRDQSSLDVGLVVIITFTVILGLLSSSKTQSAYPIISYFATCLFYRRGLSVKQVLVLFLGGAFFVAVLVPSIHAWRDLGQRKMDIPERISLLIESAVGIVTGGELKRFEDTTENQFRGGYYDYFGGDGRAQALVGRYASVQQIDPVIAAVDEQGTMGVGMIMRSILRVIPSAIYTEKPEYIEPYTILVHYGLIDPKGGKYPTLPVTGQIYAGLGWIGIVVIPFLVFLIFLGVLKKFGWDLYRNVYAIFFFCDFIIVYVNQGSLDQYAEITLRDLPLFAITFKAILVTSRSEIWHKMSPLKLHDSHKGMY